MVFFPIELRDILDGLSDLKLKVISEVSTWLAALLVDGKEKLGYGKYIATKLRWHEGWCRRLRRHARSRRNRESETTAVIRSKHPALLRLAD